MAPVKYTHIHGCNTRVHALQCCLQGETAMAQETRILSLASLTPLWATETHTHVMWVSSLLTSGFRLQVDKRFHFSRHGRWTMQHQETFFRTRNCIETNSWIGAAPPRGRRSVAPLLSRCARSRNTKWYSESHFIFLLLALQESIRVWLGAGGRLGGPAAGQGRSGLPTVVGTDCLVGPRAD